MPDTSKNLKTNFGKNRVRKTHEKTGKAKETSWIGDGEEELQSTTFLERNTKQINDYKGEGVLTAHG